MRIWSQIAELAKRCVDNRDGNIAITFALSLMPVMLIIGGTIDYSEGTRIRNQVAIAADTAILSAASNVLAEGELEDKADVERKLKAVFNPFFEANRPKSGRYSYSGVNVDYDPATKSVDVKLDLTIRTAVLGLIGKDRFDVAVNTSTSMEMSAGGAVSMFLVLDKSGSMGWSNGSGGTKMQSLKIAVNDMNSNFRSIDPNNQYVRMGAVSYDSRRQREQRIVWGSNAANNYVQRLRAYGGTNSSQAVNRAYQHLRHRREVTEHQRRSGQTPAKVLVFMTDGDNNRTSYDRNTLRTCNRAKAEGIEIYTVAFQAPSRGRNLLQNCATSRGSHYFDARNTNDLINAFRRIGAAVGEKLVLTK